MTNTGSDGAAPADEPQDKTDRPMRKASGKAEFRRIAAELELEIRQGLYPERLPNLRELQERFDAAKQTLTNALSLLRAGGLAESHGRSGMKPCCDRQSAGVIGLLWQWDDEKFQENYTRVKPFFDHMERCGFQVVLLRACSSAMAFLNNAVLPHFVGLILHGNVVTENLAVGLAARRIPFVSTSRLPLYAKIDYVNFDTDRAVETLTADLMRAGYRRIALLFASGIEGYNQLLYKMWRRIKKKLDLEILSCDKILHRDDWSWTKNAECLLTHIAAMPEKPEVLIHYGGYYEERVACYRRAADGYPFGMRLVYPATREKLCRAAPDDIVFESADSQVLLERAFPILVERMRTPDAPPIHRLVPYPIQYLQNNEKTVNPNTKG